MMFDGLTELSNLVLHSARTYINTHAEQTVLTRRLLSVTEGPGSEHVRISQPFSYRSSVRIMKDDHLVGGNGKMTLEST